MISCIPSFSPSFPHSILLSFLPFLLSFFFFSPISLPSFLQLLLERFPPNGCTVKKKNNVQNREITPLIESVPLGTSVEAKAFLSSLLNGNQILK